MEITYHDMVSIAKQNDFTYIIKNIISYPRWTICACDMACMSCFLIISTL